MGVSWHPSKFLLCDLSMKNQTQKTLYIFFSLLVLIFLVILSLSLGSVKIPFTEVLKIIIGQEPVKASWGSIVLQFRLPKVITALLAGAALSVGGLQMQTLFQNSLADPYILGVSSGASLGVALVILVNGATGSLMLAGIGFLGDLGIAVAAGLGSALVLLLVILVARKAKNTTTMLLIGIMFGYITSAFVSLLIYFSLPNSVHTYLSWTFGSFGGVTWSQIKIMVPAILAGLVIAIGLMKPLNALLLGENYAQSMGMNVKKTRFWIIISASLLSGIITAFCGPISFIGIAIPHICRGLLKTSDHRYLIPATMVIGGAMAILSDIIAQMPGNQTVLPINVVTSILGAPVVLWVLLHNQGKNRVS